MGKRRMVRPIMIEGLSGGAQLRDDFTGEVIGQSAVPTPAATLRKHQQERKQHAANRVLAIAFAKPPKVELVPTGKRKLCEINGQAVLIDLPKWRRF